MYNQVIYTGSQYSLMTTQIAARPLHVRGSTCTPMARCNRTTDLAQHFSQFIILFFYIRHKTSKEKYRE